MKRSTDRAPLFVGSAPRAIALDLDGVVYVGDTPLPGAVEAVRSLRKSGYRLYFVTNNSGKSRENLAGKLGRMGIEARPEDVFNSGYAAGVLIGRLSGHGAPSVMVIGTEDLKENMARFGCTLVNRGPCDYVVVGMDPGFTYEKITLALDALNRGAELVACNRDRSFPVGGGRLMPGCGPLVAAIECAWGRPSRYEVGKPSPMLLEIISEESGLDSGEMLVVGDSLESDIAMAKGFGCPSVLVTGGAPLSGWAPADGDDTIIMDSLMALSEALRKV